MANAREKIINSIEQQLYDAGLSAAEIATNRARNINLSFKQLSKINKKISNVMCLTGGFTISQLRQAAKPGWSKQSAPKNKEA